MLRHPSLQPPRPTPRLAALGPFVLALLGVLVPACSSPPQPAAPGAPLAVAATVAPHAWLAEQIGGERVAVTTVVPPGASPATYAPADAEVSRLLRSAVLFRCGVAMERGPWFRALEGSQRLEIVDLREGLDLRTLERHVGDHDHAAEPGPAPGETDPHTWLAAAPLRLQARTVADVLVRLDPRHAPHYRHGLADLEARLDALDADLHALLAPHAGRAFVVFHPAWGYFADAYGLRQVAIEVEGKEPSDAELTELQRLARDERVGAVFVQPQVTGRSAAAVADALGLPLVALDPLAPDPESNLRHVARALADSFRQ